VAQLSISKSVGDPQPNGTPSPNLFDDVLTVQYLLNRSPGTRPTGAASSTGW